MEKTSEPNKADVDLTNEINIIMLHLYEIASSHGIEFHGARVDVIDADTVKRAAALITATQSKRH